MGNATYDAVIIGGGNKALVLGMYLAKYGGMKVALLERTHELGGGWASEEASAPGFITNTHSTIHCEWYHLPVYEDFPDFEERGAKYERALASFGMIFKEDDACLTVYNPKYDPDQERTAREIARFSQRDADTWLRLWHKWQTTWYPAFVEVVFNPATGGGGLRQAYARLMDGIDPVWLSMSRLELLRDLFDSKELICTILRAVLSADGVPPDMAATGALTLTLLFSMVMSCFVRGGTHSLAHAAHRIILEYGGTVVTKAEVERVLIDQGKAKGVLLTDGTEIAASRLVISTLDPYQLCFRLIGQEHLSPQILKRVSNLERRYTTITWYGWALKEAPRYRAAAFNPDVDQVQWLCLGGRDPEQLVRENAWKKLGQNPPDPQMVVWCYSQVDPTQAPQGRHVCGTETFVLPANAMTEEQWLRFKKEHAEYKIRTWQQYAPNMTWDNVIGYDPITPYDICRLTNMAPEGNWSVIDQIPSQVGRLRPIPELASHRTPIKGLYATGSAWPPAGGAISVQGYNCYKVIAEDLGLQKPWEEKGRPY